MKTDIPPEELRRLIKQYKLLQNDISNALGISQGQVSRLISGEFKKPGGTYHNLCIYVSKAIKKVQPAQIEANQEIMMAIASVWDGSSEQARSIAQVIRSLDSLCRKVI